MMNDCANGDVRDLLPDLMHGRLDADRRSAVEAHLAGCADCRAELELLRTAGHALSRAPAVDVARIVAALPAPARVRASRWRAVGAWQRGAAVTALAAGLVAV